MLSNTSVSLPDIQDYPMDPNNTMAPDLTAGGKTKIRPTDMSGESGQELHTVNRADMMAQGMAPSGENSSGIPAAQPIDPITFGDPNGTAVDFKDGAESLDTYTLSGANNTYTRRGFDSTKDTQ